MTGAPAVMAAWDRTPHHAGETPEALAHRVLAAVTGAADGAESAIGIIRVGAPAYLAQVTFDASGYRIVQDAHPSPPFAVLLGWDDAAEAKTAHAIDLHQQVTAGVDANTLIRLARATLAIAAAQSPKVGGPAHVAVLDGAGTRWIEDDRDVHWDGTNLVLVSQNLTIGSAGIHLAPTTTVADDRMYGFTVADARVGVGGYTDTNLIGLDSVVQYDGANASMAVENWLQAIYAVTGQPNSSAAVSTHAGPSVPRIDLLTFYNSGLYNGEITIGGIPNFRGSTSGSAGSIAGYINIQVAGTPLKIAVYHP